MLRSVIDRRRRKGIRAGQFLLLRSASIDLLKQSAESLAGRIFYLELTPFTAGEVAALAPESLERLWVRGGFPDSFLADDPVSLEWRHAFIRTTGSQRYRIDRATEAVPLAALLTSGYGGSNLAAGSAPHRRR